MKSTIISDLFTILLIDILLDHFISDIARAYSKIATGPEMASPKNFTGSDVLVFEIFRLHRWPSVISEFLIDVAILNLIFQLFDCCFFFTHHCVLLVSFLGCSLRAVPSLAMPSLAVPS